MDSLVRLTHYLPIFSTIISAAFAYTILSRWREKPQAFHLLWWGLGVVTYGIGTLIESCVTLLGWHVVLFKSWYIFGALLGGAPLAIGSIYLLFRERVGHIAVAVLLITVTVTSVFVIASPIRYALVDPEILSSSVLGWQKIRLVSPFVNSLAFLARVGGSIYSVIKFIGIPESRHVAIGNVMIAMGMSCNPKLLLADEPTTALDVTIQAQILEVMSRLSREFGTAVIIITHNLGVVARYADRVNVMYAGRVIETASATELYGNPKHPYTVGLLNSVPRLDETRKEKLVPIEGLPPDLAHLPVGCPFYPRCSWRVDHCLEEYPPFKLVADKHYSACWESERVHREVAVGAAS